MCLYIITKKRGVPITIARSTILGSRIAIPVRTNNAKPHAYVINTKRQNVSIYKHP